MGLYKAWTWAKNKTPFVAAVEKKEGNPQRVKLNVVKGFKKKSINQWATHHITKGSTVRTDGLKCFKAIEDAGCNHEVIIVGNSRDPEKTIPFNWVNTLLGNLKTSLRGTFHKLHPKHLHRHLATFVYHFNRRFQLENMIPRLAYISVRTQGFCMKFETRF